MNFRLNHLNVLSRAREDRRHARRSRGERDVMGEAVRERDFYSLLNRVYVGEEGWTFTGTRSGIEVRDGQLLDDFSRRASVQSLYVEGELAMGFRIIPDAAEIRRYPNTIPAHYFEDCIEGNRIVVDERYRGLHLTQFVGKRAFDYCRHHDVRYAVFCGNNENMNRRFATFPRGARVIAGAVQYPEGPASALIFDTHHLIVRAFYADPVFQMFFGQRISTRMMHSLNPIA